MTDIYLQIYLLLLIMHGSLHPMMCASGQVEWWTRDFRGKTKEFEELTRDEVNAGLLPTWEGAQADSLMQEPIATLIQKINAAGVFNSVDGRLHSRQIGKAQYASTKHKAVALLLGHAPGSAHSVTRASVGFIAEKEKETGVSRILIGREQHFR